MRTTPMRPTWLWGWGRVRRCDCDTRPSRPGRCGGVEMIAYRVEIKNLPELQQRFKQAPDIATRHLITAGNQSLISLQGTAKGLTPVDTSRLRQSILVSPTKRTGNVISGAVGTSVK